MLSEVASGTIFWVFGMTQSGIKPKPLANTLPTRWVDWLAKCKYKIWKNKWFRGCIFLCMIYANILNAVSNIEQVLEAAPIKAAIVRPLTTHPENYLTDILLWTPSHWRAKARRPACTYIHQLCANTGWSLEDIPEEMDDREGWQERVREICADGVTWWWWWWKVYSG